MTKVETLIACDCAGTMTLDDDSLQRATGAAHLRRCTRACTQDLDVVTRALTGDGPVMIACGQEAARFTDLAGEIAADAGHVAPLICTDIRDRAGWSADAPAFAKQAALAAEACLDVPMTPLMDIQSRGTCLLIGGPEVALEAAARLAAAGLSVTSLLTTAPEDLVPTDDFDVALGQVRRAGGSLGRFTVRVDGFAPLLPPGRTAGFAAPRDGGTSDCDLIVDLSGETPLFPAAEKRDGYLHADPRDPLAVSRILFDAAQLTGTFEKPLYVDFDASLCAHSRAGQVGCSRCLDVCPTGAITPAGDAVTIDAGICAGCGGCAAVCPSGAASYADPDTDYLFRRLRTLAAAFGAAGGTAPRLLFHDAEHGGEMIRLSARFGRGLPADVIPLAVNNVEGVGHAELLAALGVGFAEVGVLATPHTDFAALEAQLDLARTIAGKTDTLALLTVTDPNALEDTLYAPFTATPVAAPILPLGGRREVTRSAATALRGPDTRPIPLPEGAPYGRVDVNADACTLCLACVSLCPVGALGDNPDKPQLNFQETACLQCGICARTCPENAISLTPQLDITTAALSPRVLHEEEPFACIECGKPFGVRSSIERIVETLAGKHWMFTNSDNIRLVQMCDDCRVRAQYHSDSSPFRMGERPPTRTTDDDLREREEEED